MSFRYFLAIALAVFVFSGCNNDPSDDVLECQDGMEVVDGQCACRDGHTLCGDVCVNLKENLLHCGACESVCAFGQTCSDSACVCPQDYVLCGNACVDVQSNAKHCSACDIACSATQNCVGGLCKCSGGLKACGDACVDSQSDEANCGDCGVVCTGALQCIKGACQCPEGLDACGDTCVETQADPKHCGACNKACPEGDLCVDGDCRLDCPAGMTQCAETCYDLSKTTNHCGRCYSKCKLAENAAEMMCVDSTCQVANCDDNASLCDGQCKDTRSDALNCGACDRKCESNQTCVASECRWSSFVIGTNAQDKAIDLTRDADGNFYIVGYTRGAFPGSLMRGESDAFLTKMTPSGIVVWTKQWGTSANDQAVSVVIGEDDAIYVAGNTMGSFETVITTNEQSIFLSKFNKDGEKAYDKQFGTMQMDAVIKILPAPGGGVYMAGNTQGAISGGLVLGGIDSFVMKIAADGRAIYKTLYGTSKDDVLSDMAVKSGKIYLVGTTYGPLHDGVMVFAALSPNMYIIKLTDAGTSVSSDWIKEYGSLQADAGRLIHVERENVEVKLPDNSKEIVPMDVIYAFGETQAKPSTHFDGHPMPNEGQAAFLMRIDESGARLNSRIFANEGSRYSLSALASGHLASLESEKVFAIGGTVIEKGKSYPFVWQVLHAGTVLSSSKALAENWGSIEAILGAGGEFFFVGGADEVEGKQIGNGDGYIMRRIFEL